MLLDKLKNYGIYSAANNTITFHHVGNWKPLILCLDDVEDKMKNQRFSLYTESSSYPVASAFFYADVRNPRLEFVEWCCGEGRVFDVIKL